MVVRNQNKKLLNAANKSVPNTETFTVDDFAAYMPQFFKFETKTTASGKSYKDYTCLVPQVMMDDILVRCNANILQCRWFEKWKYACSLYCAHFATMYLQTYSETSQTPTDAAAGGKMTGNAASASLGDASISYDNSMISTLSQKWGVWANTTYGLQLVNEAKLLGIGGAYFI